MQERTLNETTECGRFINISITEPWTPALLASDRHIPMARPNGIIEPRLAILTRRPSLLWTHAQSCPNAQWKDFQTSYSDFGMSNSSICRVYHEELSSIRNQRHLYVLLYAYSDLIFLFIKVILLAHIVENATALASAFTLLCIEVRQNHALTSLFLFIGETKVEG